jgi:hypothetical protein
MARWLTAAVQHEMGRLWLLGNGGARVVPAALALFADTSIHVAASARKLVTALIVPGWPVIGFLRQQQLSFAREK